MYGDKFMNNLLSTLSISALLAAPLASAFTLTQVTCRVFSPNVPDPAVNRVRFHFSNPDSGEVTIRIFDLGGALIRRNLDLESAGVMYWNGKDQGGAFVKGGVYLYQLEASNKVLTGTVVVAK